MPTPRLLTVKQVAEELQVHPETVRTWLRTGRLRGTLIADRMGWRVSAAEVERFMRPPGADGELVGSE